MRRVWISIFIIAAFVVGCMKREASKLTISVSPTASTHPPGALESEPAVTLMPTTTTGWMVFQSPTPEVPLFESGPWLLVYGQGGYKVINPDGTGLTSISISGIYLPWEHGNLNGFPGTVSNLGWIAVYTSDNWEAPSDLALTLIRLPTLEPVKTIPLLSSQVWTEIEDDIRKMDELGEEVIPSLVSEYGFPRWSPDGRQLAFISAHEGLSYDLYVYDTFTDQIRRLTDRKDQEFILDWSPDGRRIVYMQASYPFTLDVNAPGFSPSSISVWTAAVDGSTVRKLYSVDEGLEKIVGWVQSNTFFVSQSLFLTPDYNIRSVNLDSTVITSVFSGEFLSSAVDEGSGALAISLHPSYLSGWEQDRGVFVLGSEQDTPIQVELNMWGSIRWVPQLGNFFVEIDTGALEFNSFGRVISRVEGESCIPNPSPDGQWLVFGGDLLCRIVSAEGAGIRVYSADGKFVWEFLSEGVFGLLWQPDSEGLYFMVRGQESEFGSEDYYGQLMHVSIPQGDLALVHPNPGGELLYWIQP